MDKSDWLILELVFAGLGVFFCWLNGIEKLIWKEWPRRTGLVFLAAMMACMVKVLVTP